MQGHGPRRRAVRRDARAGGGGGPDDQVAREPAGGTTTTAELAIDFWLATRAVLGSGTRMLDRMRAFGAAAEKVALLCKGRTAPVPWQKECGNLSRLFYRPSAGYQGRARLFFPDEVNIILAAHQRAAGAARTRGVGKQWHWKPEEMGCPLPEPR